MTTHFVVNRKLINTHALRAVLTLMAQTMSMAILHGATFTETFPNPEGINQNASAAGWILEEGFNGDPLPWRDNGGPPANGGGLAVRTDTTPNPDGCMQVHGAYQFEDYVMRKESAAIFPATEVPTILSFDARYLPSTSNSGNPRGYFIMKVGDYWYAANKKFNPSGNLWKHYSYTLDPSSTQWIKLSSSGAYFDPVISTLLSAPPKGTINGVGLLFQNISAATGNLESMEPAYGLSIDNFTIETDSTSNYPPKIISQPVFGTVAEGGKATLTVVCNLDTGVRYQWYLLGDLLNDNEVFSGTKSATLTISPIALANAGNYFVKLTNDAGTVTSNGTQVNVSTPITIVKEMQSGSATAGTNIVLSTDATCGNPLSYIWYKKKTSSWFEFWEASLIMSSDAVGEYRCRVASEFSSKYSSNFTLSLIDQIDITAQISQTSFGSFGGSAILTATVQPADAYWNATTTAEWIHIQNQGSGFATGDLEVVIDPIGSISARQAIIKLGAQQFEIKQTNASGDSIYQFGNGTMDLGKGFKWNKLGYLYDGFYPFVYAWQIPGWIYIYGGSEEDYFFFDFQREKWCWTQSAIYPWYYSMSGDDSGQAFEFGK